MDNTKKYMMGIEHNISWLVKDMLDLGIEPHIDDLVICLMNGSTDVAKILIEDNRIDLSDDDDQCIIQSVCNNQIEIVKLLLKDKRIDPTTMFNLPIREADKYNFMEIVKLLFNDKRVYNSLSRYEKKYFENKLKST